MCRIRYKKANGERATKDVPVDMRRRMVSIHSANTTSANDGIQVSYRRYSTMIYPRVKG